MVTCFSSPAVILADKLSHLALNIPLCDTAAETCAEFETQAARIIAADFSELKDTMRTARAIVTGCDRIAWRHIQKGVRA